MLIGPSNTISVTDAVLAAEDTPLSSAGLRYLVRRPATADRPGPVDTRPLGCAISARCRPRCSRIRATAPTCKSPSTCTAGR
ncbi:hypothetical protein UA75_09835 [Actinoalloteichus sp. GBA129-24]|uniref:Uncharacterized protein n=1 Tax=Actinoalloteichus fjordicus TaxID=1612552 RepID=A0AAC9LB01_9PSEU|nr:hypothetical protein UA74_09865 [Actinoalloteichus fjordicus]APU19982.1 hypothetical protein UA75_09835 [Actinoalloteichus sp. GBA129-24]